MTFTILLKSAISSYVRIQNRNISDINIRTYNTISRINISITIINERLNIICLDPKSCTRIVWINGNSQLSAQTAFLSNVNDYNRRPEPMACHAISRYNWMAGTIVSVSSMPWTSRYEWHTKRATLLHKTPMPILCLMVCEVYRERHPSKL